MAGFVAKVKPGRNSFQTEAAVCLFRSKGGPPALAPATRSRLFNSGQSFSAGKASKLLAKPESSPTFKSTSVLCGHDLHLRHQVGQAVKAEDMSLQTSVQTTVSKARATAESPRPLCSHSIDPSCVQAKGCDVLCAGDLAPDVPPRDAERIPLAGQLRKADTSLAPSLFDPPDPRQKTYGMPPLGFADGGRVGRWRVNGS